MQKHTNDKSRILCCIVILIFFTVCSIVLSAYVIAGKTGAIDTALINFIQQDKSPVLQILMSILTDIGNEYFVVVIIFIAGLWLWTSKSYGYLEEFMLVSLVSYIVNILVKSLVHRQRPFSWLGVTASGYSFPSGHSIMTFVIAAELVLILRRLHLARWWVYSLAFIIVLAVGISRVYLGVHWPSDVAGGWLMGSTIIIAYSLLDLTQKIQ